MPTYSKDWNWFCQVIDSMAATGIREAEVRSVMVRVGSSWQVYASRMRAAQSISELDAQAPASQVFGRLALVRKMVSLNVLASPDRDTTLGSWPGLGMVSLPTETPASQFSATFYGSHNRFGSGPVWAIPTGNGVNARALDSTEVLLHPALPLYRSVADAAADWLGDQSILQNGYPSYTALYLLEPSQMCVDQLSFQQDAKLFVVLKPLLPGAGPLYLKVRAQQPEGPAYQFNQAVSEAEVHLTLDMPGSITELLLFIVDEQGQPHDHFEETLSYCSWPQSIIKGEAFVVRQQLVEQIYQGEGPTLEFKEWLPVKRDKPKRMELHETAVAFANTEGGTILVGVDDRGEISGIERSLRKDYNNSAGTLEGLVSTYRQEIRRSISSEIDPGIELEFDDINFDGHLVIAIRIKKGRRPPYRILHSNEIYVRRGANNMRPNPDELRRLLGSSA